MTKTATSNGHGTAVGESLTNDADLLIDEGALHPVSMWTFHDRTCPLGDDHRAVHLFAHPLPERIRPRSSARPHAGTQ